MASFWGAVNKVIEDSDLLLLVLDSRLSVETLNIEVENKLKHAFKPFIYVFNKCDLVNQKDAEHLKKQFKPSVFVSSKEFHGLKMLRELILVICKKKYPDKKKFVVGVLGYPNVGKSSLINALNGRRSAGTSSISGFTKGLQRVKVDNKLVFLDTPGVIPYKEKNVSKHSVIGVVDFSKAKEPEIGVFNLMKSFGEVLDNFYGFDSSMDFDEKIEAYALKNKMLLKGGVPDARRAARKILQDWQEGKIKL